MGKMVRALVAAFTSALMLTTVPSAAQDGQAATAEGGETLFRNVRVFDGSATALSGPTNVLVRGNVIAAIGPEAIPTAATKTIDGRGRTLMPGLIDVHVHLTFGALTMAELGSPDLTPAKAGEAAAANATQTLMRGFTSVRDVGGPIFEVKKMIDAGRIPGPRIWPSGPTVSQTSGHGDYRLPHEGPRR
jgi:imidazolonepropionase-like amidohydrolase